MQWKELKQEIIRVFTISSRKKELKQDNLRETSSSVNEAWPPETVAGSQSECMLVPYYERLPSHRAAYECEESPNWTPIASLPVLCIHACFDKVCACMRAQARHLPSCPASGLTLSRTHEFHLVPTGLAKRPSHITPPCTPCFDKIEKISYLASKVKILPYLTLALEDKKIIT